MLPPLDAAILRYSVHYYTINSRRGNTKIMFYIIYGDDNYRCHQALNELKGAAGPADMVSVNTTVLDGRKLTARELSDVCSVVPFMTSSRLVIVEGLLRRFHPGDKRGNGNDEDGAQGNKEWQNIADYIKAMPPTTTLVLFEPDMDGRAQGAALKALSQVADKVLQFNELKGRELASWIKDYAAGHGGRISAAAVSMLADFIGGDLWSLSGEIDKLATYCGDREIAEADVREISSFAREESIFALVDAVMEGRVKESQLMLHRMLRDGTAPQQILAMIERQLSIILRAKDLAGGTPAQEIKEKLGLHPRYPLEKTLKQARSFTVPRLRKAFHCLLDTDIAIKTGRYDDDLGMDLMVIELCKK